jgi:hypothetical protein
MCTSTTRRVVGNERFRRAPERGREITTYTFWLAGQIFRTAWHVAADSGNWMARGEGVFWSCCKPCLLFDLGSSIDGERIAAS